MWSVTQWEQKEKSLVHNEPTVIIEIKRYGRAIPVKVRADPYGCETSTFPHFLANQLTDGGEVVSLTRRPPFTSGILLVLISVKRLSRPQGHSAAGRIT
jgi:hypothetical protein